MRGAHLALAVNNPKTTLLMATAKFFGQYKQSSRHQTWSAAWVTAHAPPLVEASENIQRSISRRGQPKPGGSIEPHARRSLSGARIRRILPVVVRPSEGPLP
jgi:hypothetical protein